MPDPLPLAALGVVLVGLLYFGAQLVTLARIARHLPLLERLPAEHCGCWPRVSAVITARNEAASLESAMRVRLADDYPDLELILVDDRSTDATSEIARRLALADPRVRVERIDELPAGWLGKVHALQRGLERASGQWLLFSDGDVSVHAGVLRRLVAYCERRGLDHCAVLPRLRPVHPLLDCLTSMFLRLVVLHLRPWALEDPRSRASAGIGAFNLVRRAALERTPGFAWLRMEVADDLCLGEMLKASGARQSAVNGRAMVDLQFHASVGDALRSAERASFTAIGNFSLLRLAGLALATLGLELSPVIALALARTPLTIASAAALLGVALAAGVAANRIGARPSGNLLLFPVCAVLSAYSLVRSGVLGAVRGGILWRGTFYPSEALRAGRRYRTAWRALAPRSR